MLKWHVLTIRVEQSIATKLREHLEIQMNHDNALHYAALELDSVGP